MGRGRMGKNQNRGFDEGLCLAGFDNPTVPASIGGYIIRHNLHPLWASRVPSCGIYQYMYVNALRRYRATWEQLKCRK